MKQTAEQTIKFNEGVRNNDPEFVQWVADKKGNPVRWVRYSADDKWSIDNPELTLKESAGEVGYAIGAIIILAIIGAIVYYAITGETIVMQN